MAAPAPGPAAAAPAGPLIKIFVGKLAASVDDAFLRTLTSCCGLLHSWRREATFAYLEYAQLDEVRRAIQLLDGKTVDGQAIIVRADAKTKQRLEEHTPAEAEVETDKVASERIDAVLQARAAGVVPAGMGAATTPLPAPALAAPAAAGAAPGAAPGGAPGGPGEHGRSSLVNQEISKFRDRGQRPDITADLQAVREDAERRERARQRDLEEEFARRLRKWEHREEDKEREYQRADERDESLRQEREKLHAALYVESDSEEDGEVATLPAAVLKRVTREKERDNEDRKKHEQQQINIRIGKDAPAHPAPGQDAQEPPAKKARVANVFADADAVDDDGDVEMDDASKRKPVAKLEYSAEELAAIKADPVAAAALQRRMEAEERADKEAREKALAAVPTDPAALFAHAINWSVVEKLSIVQNKIAPWVEGKITAFLGEAQPDLVSFVLGLVKPSAKPDALITELTEVLDAEARPFVQELWRMLAVEVAAST